MYFSESQKCPPFDMKENYRSEYASEKRNNKLNGREKSVCQKQIGLVTCRLLKSVTSRFY